MFPPLPYDSDPTAFSFSSLHIPGSLLGPAPEDTLSPFNPFAFLESDTESWLSSSIGTPPDARNADDLVNSEEYLMFFRSPELPNTIAPSLLLSQTDYPHFDEYQDEPFSGPAPPYDSDPTGWLDEIHSQQVALRSLDLPKEKLVFLAESDGDDDSSDGDYVPSPKAGPRKRGRSTSSSRTVSSTRRAKRVAYTLSSSHLPSATPSPPSTPAPQTQHSTRQHPPPRNTQVTINLDEIQNLNFVCPVENCSWNKRRGENISNKNVDVNEDKKKKKKNDNNQQSRRLPDFKRHLKSHMKPKNIKCLGVRVSEASQFIIRPGAEPYDIGVEGEEQYIGGCKKQFSRSDALKRHIRTSNCAHYSKRRRTITSVDA